MVYFSNCIRKPSQVDTSISGMGGGNSAGGRICSESTRIRESLSNLVHVASLMNTSRLCWPVYEMVCVVFRFVRQVILCESQCAWVSTLSWAFFPFQHIHQYPVGILRQVRVMVVNSFIDNDGLVRDLGGSPSFDCNNSHRFASLTHSMNISYCP